MSDAYDVIIAGGGPAGLTAGIYCSRAGLKTLLVEKLVPGGQVMTAHMIENYPGFPEGITGPDLMERFVKQAMRFGLETVAGSVNKVTIEGDLKTLHLDDRILKSKALIVSTGAVPGRLNIPGEDAFIGKGVSYCATCDGAFFRNADIAVIGGGNSAISEALYLTRFANRVYIIHRRDSLRAEAILQDEARAHPKISFILSSTPEGIVGDMSGVNALQMINLKDGSRSGLSVQGVFIYVGMKPDTAFLAGVVDLTPEGYIKAGEDGKTSVSGIFAAGDVRSKSLRQIATAVGDGAAVSHSVEEYLK